LDPKTRRFSTSLNPQNRPFGHTIPPFVAAWFWATSGRPEKRKRRFQVKSTICRRVFFIFCYIKRSIHAQAELLVPMPMLCAVQGLAVAVARAVYLYQEHSSEWI
jgi:tRNA G18 (ribose-2'-O)-methylase SpoU